jgi:spore germination cell wall hydrolase CwlJ-like protein
LKPDRRYGACRASAIPPERTGAIGLRSTMQTWLTALRGAAVRAGRRGTFALVGLLCFAVSAHAAQIESGYETEDHFPGSALLYVADEDAAPTHGVTGTTLLPNLPIPADAQMPAGDGSVIAAQPFSMAGASALDRGRALECLTAAIYYEAATEPDAGQQAVAQVILNRVRHPAFPNTVCGVVYQGSERTTGCQFSFACDGSMGRTPSRPYWLRAMKVAAAALDGHVMAGVGLATHYHTYAVTPSWNRDLVMTGVFGAHFFHRWQGWWGTPAAFRQVYRGGEPFPGPHPRPATQSLAPLTIAAAARVPVGVQPAAPLPAPTNLAAIQPAYRDASVMKPAANDDALPGDSQILDKWKDSGKPLR